MSIKIERGLFKYDFIDHHAVLCVPVDADLKTIRKRYLKIARRLHPDSCATASDKEKKLASALLSKLVNPAYEKLSQEKAYAEYMVVLSQFGKRLVQDSASIDISTDMARQLAAAPNVDQLYRVAIAKIAETQFESLEKVVPIIAHISELNMVYLMRNGGKKFNNNSPSATAGSAAQNTTKSGATASGNTQASGSEATATKEDSRVMQYLRRAQDLMAKNQFAQARVELQDAIKLAPQESRAHSLIGEVYLKQNQMTMAKVHFERALKLNPNDEKALGWMAKLEKLAAAKSVTKPDGKDKTGKEKTQSGTAATGTKKPDNKSEGGGLFGLFGSKKK